MHNINDTYFDGFYKDIWKAIIPDELSIREIEFIVSYFNLEQGASVLDLMCGHGRHSLRLARKGIKVIAVDILDEYVKEINSTAATEKLPVESIKSGVLEYTTTEKFDLVLLMGNSLNFFNADDTNQLLSNISFFLKKGGHLLINTWSLAEIAIKTFKDRTWSNIGDLKFLTESKYLFYPARIETEHLVLSVDGQKEAKLAIDYIFSINEIENMINASGLTLSEIYSVPGRKKFSLGDPRAYIIATKL